MSIGAAKAATSKAAIVTYGVFISGNGSASGPAGSLTTNTVTANVTGGVPSFTYNWIVLSGDPITINSPSSASTSFTTTGAPEQTKSSVIQVTVTDSNTPTASVDTDTINVFFDFDPV